jgi:hypothetical protein
MKVTVEYNLPEDGPGYKLSLASSGMHSVLFEMDRWLRNKIKYDEAQMTDEEFTAYQTVREHLLFLMRENNVNLDLD